MAMTTIMPMKSDFVQTSVECCVWGRCQVTSYVSNTHDPQPQHSSLMNNLLATQLPPMQLNTLEAWRGPGEEVLSLGAGKPWEAGKLNCSYVACLGSFGNVIYLYFTCLGRPGSVSCL